MEEISIVIGSWGSYNECNERALGSKWLNLSDYYCWDEIEEELKKEGFKLDGIDEELFIQDIEGLPADCKNWDSTNPQDLFETLQDANVLCDEYKNNVMQAFLEVRNFDEFEQRVKDNGSNWDEDIYIYENTSWYDLGYNFLHESHSIPDFLDSYIDYERYGEEYKYDGFEEYSNGIIEIR
ncbi:MAG: antirestriction protein ArdA [Clostridiales bacterium]|nr:antirestriction protein ArdA [Candidatus Apopatousia equi]